MKKIIVAPGAFKHSLTASAAAQAVAAGLHRSGLAAELHLMPIADGGNGTLDAFLAGGGERVPVTVEDPVGRPVEAAFALLPDGKTAVIEMALASGLELLDRRQLNPLRASTYGTGQLLQAALARGATRVIVGLGGSATVDGGAGCAQALGVSLLDAYGVELPRGGGGLERLFVIDPQKLDPRWRGVEVLIAADVTNPALGPDGAAAVFGPQKGATPEQAALLERNLSHFFRVVNDQLRVDVRSAAGGGAAGGLSAGLMAFLGGQVKSGIDLLLAYSGFSALLAGADLVVTGEGRLDGQTLQGKGPHGVALLAREHGVPTVALVGSLELDDAALHRAGIQAALPIVSGPMPLERALDNAAELLERAALRLGYLLQV